MTDDELERAPDRDEKLTGFGARRRPGYLERRRDKIVEEIQRNRRGDYTIPTWVLVTILAVLVVGFAALLYFV